MKKLGIITASKEVGEFYKSILIEILGDYVEIHKYSFEDNSFENKNEIEKLKKSDVILISTYSQYEIIKKYIGGEFNYVIVKLTLSKWGFDIINNLKDVKEAMLVNLSMEMCLETIGLLYQLGIDHINFIPVYPNMEKIPDLKVAITTGEARYVPKEVNETYDLGHRLMDESTIVELLISLDLEHLLSNESVTKYFSKLVKNNTGIGYLLTKSNVLNDQLNTLLRLMDKGVIFVNSENIIISCNGNGENIVNKKQHELIGKSSKLLFPEIDFKKDDIVNKLVKVNDKNVLLSVYKIINDIDYKGAYAIIEDFESTENTRNQVRLQMLKKGHIAKYNINDIIGNSFEISEVRNLIKRMAKSDYSVLITGETGTGKELVANAIHNLSYNRDKHFIAINCAAFNASLLESELFGYEPGSFTGASKTGKRGIFEYANNGTLFLDEIGEMPLELQTKLLRVIQEKEIMRVGGNEIIKVDFRMIAATNIDLESQVRKGLFRKDLYYRLNVLPINIPPLRNRKEDISDLIKDIVDKKNYKFSFEEETMAFLKNYEWDGNVRELINCLEYLDSLGIEKIEINDLPHHIRNKILDERCWEEENSFIQGYTDEEVIVLQILYEAFRKRRKMGRRSISEKAYAKNLPISEYEVKRIIEVLSQKGLVEIKLGRGGTSLTQEGIKLFQQN